jgi:hypothetical protein
MNTEKLDRRISVPRHVLAVGSTPEAGPLRFVVPLMGEFEQETMTVDLTGWSRPVLARAFAIAMRDDLLAPGTMCTKEMVRSRIRELYRFWTFLDQTDDPVAAIEEVAPALIDRYEAWLSEAVGGGDIHRRHLLARPIALLRFIELNKPGTLLPQTVERLGYLTHLPCAPSLPRDAYSASVAAAIRRAARDQILDAARRIAPEGELPPVPDGLHETVRSRYATLIAEIDRRGSVPVLDPIYNRVWQTTRDHHPAIKGPYFEELHGQFHLTVVDVIGFLALLSLEVGIEIECLARLKADCLKNPAKGFVDVEYLKRRSRGAEWKRLRVRDGGTTTPGGLIRLALRLTARARKHRGGDALWTYISPFGLTAFKDVGITARYFVRRHKLVDDDGKPLALHLSRLRKTYKAEWYVKTNGQLEDFAVGHTTDVAANHYADIPALRHLHEQTVADALQDALDAALKPRLVVTEDEVAPRANPARADLPVPPAEVTAFLDGAQDVWLARCGSFYDSPFGTKGKACPVPFWGCLECKNAVITSGKLPALIAFLEFMVAQREVLSGTDWAAKFGRAYGRIADQILPAFPEVQVCAARAIAASRSDVIYLPPEAGAR